MSHVCAKGLFGAPRANAFDQLRLLLALGILGFHSVTISEGSADTIPGPVLLLLRLILPMFFAMSGFLVAASLERTGSAFRFLGARLWRLMPALAAVTAGTALLLGPLLTETPREYWEGVPSYLLNAVASPHYALPGLFPHNPRMGVVNGSFWTIRIEVSCCVLLALTACAGRWLPLALGLLASALWTVAFLAPGWLHWFDAELGLAFLAGAIFFHLAARLPLNGVGGVFALLAALLLAAWPAGVILTGLPLVYVVAWLGSCRLPRLPGDYAYGVYLCGYPLQQIIVQALPGVAWWQTFLLTVPCVFTCAALLWHFVERPCNALRHRQSALASAAATYQERTSRLSHTERPCQTFVQKGTVL